MKKIIYSLLTVSLIGLVIFSCEKNDDNDNSTVTFHYEINLNDTSDFLDRYNMPEYYSDYEFQNGYLIRFKFGFEYS